MHSLPGVSFERSDDIKIIFQIMTENGEDDFLRLACCGRFVSCYGKKIANLVTQIIAVHALLHCYLLT